jgi:formylglycine-generating enzyme required for sulfatase activity
MGLEYVQSFLKQKCAACHGSAANRVVAGMNVLQRDALIQSGHLVAESPLQSPIWQRIERGEMPPPHLRPISVEDKVRFKKSLAAVGQSVGQLKTIVETIRGDPRLSRLYKIAEVAGALELLQNPGPFTILAPVNEAFDAPLLPTAVWESMRQDPSHALDVLLNHGIAWRACTVSELERLGTVSAASGYELTVRRHQPTGRLWVGDQNAVVQEADIKCSNGIVHLVDRLLLPPGVGPPAGFPTKLGIPMLEIRGGRFAMGTPAHLADGSRKDETPQREVQVSTFYLSTCEITFNEYRNLMDNPAPVWLREEPGGGMPAYDVHWFQAAEFCNKHSGLDLLEPYYEFVGTGVDVLVNVPNPAGTGYRLPTEAEWEYACRAGTADDFCCDESVLSKFAWLRDNAGGVPHPVKEKLPNQFGLYDMHGNVAEWCDDWYSSSYDPGVAGQVLVDPRVQTLGPLRLKSYRGGSFIRRAADLRSAWRSGAAPNFQHQGIGFRIARSLRRGERAQLPLTGNGAPAP